MPNRFLAEDITPPAGRRSAVRDHISVASGMMPVPMGFAPSVPDRRFARLGVMYAGDLTPRHGSDRGDPIALGAHTDRSSRGDLTERSDNPPDSERAARATPRPRTAPAEYARRGVIGYAGHIPNANRHFGSPRRYSPDRNVVVLGGGGTPRSDVPYIDTLTAARHSEARAAHSSARSETRVGWSQQQQHSASSDSHRSRRAGEGTDTDRSEQRADRPTGPIDRSEQLTERASEQDSSGVRATWAAGRESCVDVWQANRYHPRSSERGYERYQRKSALDGRPDDQPVGGRMQQRYR